MAGVILVAGPPCAGKTTYVEQHKAPGDEVVDFDVLVDREADGPEREAGARRWRALVDAPLKEGITRWVIWTAPRRSDRGRFRAMHGAGVVVVWTPHPTCLARARVERPPIWARYIPAWFDAFQPSSSDREIVVSGGGDNWERLDPWSGDQEMQARTPGSISERT